LSSPRDPKKDEEKQRLSSSKAVAAAMILAALAIGTALVFVLVLSQRACS
jgi:hypothetical protein